MQDKMVIRGRIDVLRQLMKRDGIDAYLIVTEDFHGSEYVGDYFKCREFMSGFDGSAGTMVVTADEANLWTDGRYFLQAEEQLDRTGIILRKMGVENVPTIQDYLWEKLKEHATVSYDGRTISENFITPIKEKLQKKEIVFREDVDLVGKIWGDRPKLCGAPIWQLEKCYHGCERKEKINKIRDSLKEAGADSILLASLDDIAWLYNLRGNDILYNPVFLAYSFISEKETILYVMDNAMDEGLKKELENEGITLRSYFAIYEELTERSKNRRLLLDKTSINVSLLSKVDESAEIIWKMSPVTKCKSIKNQVEQDNLRKAHIMDGLAVTRLIYWIKESYRKKNNKEQLNELAIADKLEEFRRMGEGYLGQSFAPIIATGYHGAIVHYEPTKESNIPLENNSFLLMDTGGQYLYGTTDITRTIAVGELSVEQKKHYTAVLRGHLNLMSAKFKEGCTGANLDILARQPLWEMGLDFNHGTGHGVGYLLNVHEGPNCFRQRGYDGGIGVPFEEGMLTSNEPGFYLSGRYGIRLENLVLCKQAATTEMGRFLEFETVTLVPFDKEAILVEDLTDKDKEVLNSYHKEVYEKLASYLSAKEREWLSSTTKALD